MRFLFLLFGLPIMMMSFFEVSDAIPLANQASLLVDGTVIEMTAEQQTEFNEKVCSLFEGSKTLPAFSVMLHDEFVESVKDGTYVCLTYAHPMDVNGLTFDQLIFEVSCDSTGFDIVRGNRGIYQGRCIHVDLGEGNMQELCEFVDSLDTTSSVETPEESKDGEEDLETEEGQGEEELSNEAEIGETDENEVA